MKIATLFFACALLITNIAQASADPLDKIHEEIKQKYTDVEHISPIEYSKLNEDDIVVFDVRKPGEYAVSHLANAKRVNPNISAETFFAEFGELLEGKKAVFYCSVGRRSSNLIERLEQQNAEFDFVNLEGGIFKWTNQTRAVNGKGVHPYNWHWSRLIEDKSKIHYTPVDDIPVDEVPEFK